MTKIGNGILGTKITFLDITKIFNRWFIPSVQCMRNNIVDISHQVHQMLLAKNPAVPKFYPVLAYLSVRASKKLN